MSSFLIFRETWGLIFFNQFIIFFLQLFLFIIYFLYSLLIYNLKFSWNLLFIFLIILSCENLLYIPFKAESFFILPIFLFILTILNIFPFLYKNLFLLTLEELISSLIFEILFSLFIYKWELLFISHKFSNFIGLTSCEATGTSIFFSLLILSWLNVFSNKINFIEGHF